MKTDKLQLQKQFFKSKNKAKFLTLYKHLFSNIPYTNWTTDIKFNGLYTVPNSYQFNPEYNTVCQITSETITVPYTIAFQIISENISGQSINGIFIRDSNNLTPTNGTIINNPNSLNFPIGYGNAIVICRPNTYNLNPYPNLIDSVGGNSTFSYSYNVSSTLQWTFIIKEDWNNVVTFAFYNPYDPNNKYNVVSQWPLSPSINSTNQRSTRSIGLYSTRLTGGTYFNPFFQVKFVQSPI